MEVKTLVERLEELPGEFGMPMSRVSIEAGLDMNRLGDVIKYLHNGKDILFKGVAEMAEMSKNHGMEMYKEGDEEHIKVMNKMRENMNDPDAMKNYMESKQKEFDALPEDK